MRLSIYLTSHLLMAVVVLSHSFAFAAGPNEIGQSKPAKMPLEGSSLVLFPEQVDFKYVDDVQRIGVQIRMPDGTSKDITGEVEWLRNEDVVLKGTKLSSAADCKPGSMGVLEGVYAGQKITLPYQVGKSKGPRELSFRNDILPVLTKTGCNSGKCHGSASGKDGFRLSLYGFDPEGDFFRITREMSGRRINLARPETCLMVNKAIGEVPHTGGSLMEPGDPNYVKLVRWIAGGAEPDPESMPLPVSIDVFPTQAVLAKPGQKQNLIVMAKYDDGSVRDVTDTAVFLSNNDGAASVSADGSVFASGAGTAFVLARFDQFTSGTSIVVRSGERYPGLEFGENNYIDQFAAARWRDLQVLPSPLSTDEVFLRRVYLDLTGRLPTPQQRAEFLANEAADKRDVLVDELVESKDFLDIWIMQLAELLQVRRANGLSQKGLSLYDGWLREQVHAGVPLNELVRQLIPATGSTFENPASSYYQTETTPQLLAENIAQAFLGTRIQCAQCHNHPFDRWTMDDYYGFAAFVSQVGYKQAKDPREITVYNLGEGALEHPVPGREVKPKFLGGAYASEEELEGDQRSALAEWLADNNHAFARNIANVLWSHFMGMGIVEPVDDVRVSNPPSNPELLNALGAKLAEYDFDVKKLASDICKSKTYQLSTQKTDWNRWDDRNFSHANIRRLRAEVLLDCINQVTETSDTYAGLPLGGRAIEIPDGDSNNYFLDTFGRSDRETACSCEVSTAPTLSQALHLLNGENTTGKIQSGPRISKLLSDGSDFENAAAKLYLVCFGREPTSQEATAIRAQLSQSEDPRAELGDLFWALLNSNEFIFNH
ncbi:MAG: DUF1549 domain-containing protein [Aureliella sp.]